jgi:hypothetical protein
MKVPNKAFSKQADRANKDDDRATAGRQILGSSMLRKRLLKKRLRRNLIALGLLIFVWLTCSAEAAAGSLTDTLRARQQSFPNWESKPLVQPSEGDLVYPRWMEGTWRMSSTLIEMVAPLAPEIVTPGFEGNRQFLNKPVPATIRFIPVSVSKGRFLNQPLVNQREDAVQIVSDRAFNGLNLARAYLGEDWVKAVKSDPNNPNRQITFLKDNQQLISTVTGRAVETPTSGMFATTEIFQQFFRNTKNPAKSPITGASEEPTIYLNEVENTTIYRQQSDANFPIGADQMTAIYLSPQDPNYFKAKDKPVALYRYQLSFSPL